MINFLNSLLGLLLLLLLIWALEDFLFSSSKKF